MSDIVDRLLHYRPTALEIEAADEIKRLRAELADAVRRCNDEYRANKFAAESIVALHAKLAEARKALQSIADNSCCAPCREAGLVAKAALAQLESKP